MLDIARRPLLWRSAIALAVVAMAAWLVFAPPTVGADANHNNDNGAHEGNDKDKGDKDKDDGWKVVAKGLNNPRGLDFGPDGTLYVAEAGKGGDGPCVPSEGEGEGPPPEDEPAGEVPGGAEANGEGGEENGEGAEPPGTAGICYGGSGAITRIGKDGKTWEISGAYPSLAEGDGSFATGLHDVSVGDDGTIYGIVGLGAHPGERLTLAMEQPRVWVFGSLLEVDPDTGHWEVLKDVSLYEWMENPDDSAVDSNPYSVLAEDGSRYVVDAGGNSLLHVMDDGTIETVAVFPDREVERPDELPAEVFPDTIPMQAVPTSVVRGPDGALYVGQLTGFPFPVGEARVYRIEEGEEPEVYAEGFTNISDIAFDKDGNLLVLEFAKDGLLAAEMAAGEGGELPFGALIRVNDEGEHEEIASEGLVMPGGLAVDEWGNMYVSNCGICAGDGEVIRIRAETAAADPLAGGVVATFDVSGEQFKVWVTNERTIEEMYAVLAGNSNATIPNGPILRGPGKAGHNAPRDWHLDPQQTEMAEVTIEVCDGRPSYVDENIDEFVDNVGRYCPWSAELVNIVDHRQNQ